jgi:cytochrome P450
MVRNLVHGGLDTVRAMMSFIAWFLADHPAHRRMLVEEPALIPNAVEELLRWFAIPSLARSVVEDLEFHGVSMRKDEQILLPLVLYGADQRIQDAPHEVDFRTPKVKHLSFGTGPHFCPGSHLARTELVIFLEEWLKRIPDFELTPGTRPTASGGIVAGVSSLPLTWAFRA